MWNLYCGRTTTSLKDALSELDLIHFVPNLLNCFLLSSSRPLSVWVEKALALKMGNKHSAPD